MLSSMAQWSANGIILDNQVLDLCQLVGYTLVVVFVLVKQTFVLVLYMGTDFICELVVAS